MFPKTECPDDMYALLLSVSKGSTLPLWQAAPLVAAFANVSAPALRAYFPMLQPPEEQLRGSAPPEEAGAVYRLCALLIWLLSGKELQRTADPGYRRVMLRTLAADVCPVSDESDSLFRLLDRGLRLEPTRRFPDRGALLAALGEAEEVVNTRVRPGLCLRGTAGVFTGKTLPLAPPDTLGRQPDLCQILFPPDTGGVSRRHCRLDLVWGTVLVTDLHSRYGTAAGGTTLSPDHPCPLLPGQVLALAGGSQAFLLTKG